MALQAAGKVIVICADNTTTPVAGKDHRKKSIWEKVGKSNTYW